MNNLVLLAVAALCSYGLYRLGLQRIQLGRNSWVVGLELAAIFFLFNLSLGVGLAALSDLVPLHLPYPPHVY